MLKLVTGKENIMYSYIKGIIKEINKGYIVLENNDIGYMIYVSDAYSYKINDSVVVYLYQQIREDENTLYGFKSKENKELFLKLISVKGLGCKMALALLVNGNVNELYSAIDNGDINYLKKFPKIGDKVARQIILDLKGKLQVENDSSKKDFTLLTDTLKSLGYKPLDIKRILPNIDCNLSVENQVKEALKLLLK